ncbi:MAG TPA: ATP-binding protein [Acetobacteraceae bacterium]|nr:ATP-binding protein [Acetobacteraceae bacterium]
MAGTLSRSRNPAPRGRGQGPVSAVSAYIVLYLLLDRLTLVHEVDGVGFTLWNPTPALGLGLLLIRGLRYAPALFIAGVLADLLIEAHPGGLAAVLAINVIIAVGYTVVAVLLLRVSAIGRGLRRVGDVIGLLLIAGVGTLVVATLVAGTLLLMQQLPTDQLGRSVRHFWSGDFSGILGLLPVLLTARQAWERWTELPAAARMIDIAVFAVGLALALWLILAAGDSEFQFFYLLLLPIAWIGVRHGLPWCAIAILIEQIVLVSLLSLLDYPAADFMAFQELSLAIAGTGLALGAVVTERQHAELSLRQQQMELGRMARLTTVGAMGSAIVHEVSQPLATIATYMHAARRVLMAQPARSAVLVETLGKAEAEALRAGEIVERVRDFLSRGDIRLSAVDLVQSARRIVAILADEARSRGVQVSIEARSLAAVVADQIQIEQVLMNLLRNAIDAAAEHRNGERRVRVDVRRLDGDIEVAIEDNGPGVSPDIAERLFEPFETSKPRGLGLGLPLSLRIIEAHGGRLWWDRTARAGTRFVFRMPSRQSGAA